MATASSDREPEIDGLRSFAIVPVVLYHAGWSALPGGFVGVDVFFVVSGYLITRILDREIGAGDFSLWRFYERRARRIMPALAVVLVFCCVVACLILLPADLVRFARSLEYTVLFGSNVYFFEHTGYFDAAADSYALLHTWSLAVEEQFYLVFPLLLLAATRLMGRHRMWSIAVLALASLAWGVVVSGRWSAFAFYLPYTRAWELLAGSLLALHLLPVLAKRLAREAIAAASLLAIVATVALLHEGRDFPGWVALFPVLGAAGILYASPGTLVGRLLSQRPLVGIGLVSYSLYLWHWPLLVFGAYWLSRPLTLPEGSALVVAALLLSILSWKFVEQPFRNRGFLPRRAIFGLTAAGIGVILIMAAAMVYWQGIPERLPPDVRVLAAGAKDFSPLRYKCHSKPLSRTCKLGDAKATASIAVWSDSHGVELAYALGELAAPRGVALVELSSSSCPPAIGHSKAMPAECAKRNNRVLQYIADHPNLTTVILAAWVPGEGYLHDYEGAISALKGLGRNIVLEYPTPRGPYNVPLPARLALQQWRSGQFDPVLISRSGYEARFETTIANIDRLARKYGTTTKDPSQVLCDQAVCHAVIEGRPTLFDGHHPSMAAERMNALQYTDIILAAAKP